MRKIELQFLAPACLALTLASIAYAQQSKGAAPAPVPEQIGASQKVFVANAGGEFLDAVTGDAVFDGGPYRPYNEFYSALNSWGRYELVPSPAKADLVLEIGWDLKDTGFKLPVLGELRLRAIDPKTHITLWTFNEYISGAILLGNRDKNLDQAMNAIVSRLKQLMTSTASVPTHN